MSILNPKEPNEFSCHDDRPDNNGWHTVIFDERYETYLDWEEIPDENKEEEIENDDLENFEA